MDASLNAIDWVRNLGFSLFMSLLYYKGLDFFTLDKEYQIIEKRKRNIEEISKNNILEIKDNEEFSFRFKLYDNLQN